MNIEDYAMELEKEGERFYRRLSETAPNSGLIKIFNWLAEEEVKHYFLFKKMKEGMVSEVQPSDILFSAKELFKKLAEEKSFDFGETQVSLYRDAQKVEKKSEDFYLQTAESTPDLQKKTMLLKIANEEKKHFFLLEKIIDFVSRPQRWLENAEFNQLEEY